MDRHRDPDEPRGRRRVQRGIATLEFSLTVTMLLMFVCAVVGYGVLFWMQQQL
ncbi:pilus assembly protein, partial [Achromobacter xylosoxidans]